MESVCRRNASSAAPSFSLLVVKPVIRVRRLMPAGRVPKASGFIPHRSSASHAQLSSRRHLFEGRDGRQLPLHTAADVNADRPSPAAEAVAAAGRAQYAQAGAAERTCMFGEPSAF